MGLSFLSKLPENIQQYLIITTNYWAFTLTDGALRMLIVLYFYGLGYSPLNIAMLFLFYEFFGIITNLLGGWLGARIGLNKTMNIGLSLQVLALSMLLVPSEMLTVIWVMFAQALSGIAKDLNKMSAKSAIKLLVPNQQQGKLYKWVAFLTGSKNTLKGIGFFLGGVLLALFGFSAAIAIMVVVLVLTWLFSLLKLKTDLGKSAKKSKLTNVLSKSREINILSTARFFLFGARDVWFVVALPVYLSAQYNWEHWVVGSFLALWVIGYGIVQSLTPLITRVNQGYIPDRNAASLWAFGLAIIPLVIAFSLWQNINSETVLIVGLMVFGVLFAINSSIHSYLIVSYASRDGVSLDVGYYYMANAAGRLIGTVLSGWLYQIAGLSWCLVVSSVFVLLAAFISTQLPAGRHVK